MKKLLSLTAISALALTTVANAQYVEKNPTEVEILTIEQIQTLPEDTKITTKGKISKKLNDEKYQLTNGTQNIIIEIDDEIWNGQKVTADDMIIITGEVDKDMFKDATIDVETIEIIAPMSK